MDWVDAAIGSVTIACSEGELQAANISRIAPVKRE
jgi:hypothetical protein